MSSNDKKPVIFLAFANEQGDVNEQGYLRGLPDESRLLRSILEQADDAGLCELVVETNARLDDILKKFQDPKYVDRIAIFHFAGHANDYQLALESTGGQVHAADARGLATVFGQQAGGMKLVFLNGCSTQIQAQGLLEANVSAVIATSRAIEDSVATQFAGYFYKEMAAGATLERAFKVAEGATIAKYGSDTRNLYRKIGTISNKEIIVEDNPWHLYVRPGSESRLNYNLPDATGNPLLGLPPLPEKDLPAKPYKNLNWFTSKDAEVFFGRGYQIRELYQFITNPSAAPIILFCGQTGVGKSSLLAAGLIPRLENRKENPHTVRYFRRTRGKGLATMFSEELNSAPEVPFLEAWSALETKTDNPVSMVVDQLEEVFTRPSNKDKDKGEDELGVFLKKLVPVYEIRSSRPKGKLILSFRKEWILDVKRRLKELNLHFKEYYLEALDQRGLIEAIEGPATTERLHKHWGLTIESGLAESMAHDLLKDAKSSLAPTLQIRLGRLWDKAGSPPKFTKDLYDKLESEGYGLDRFLDQQFSKLTETHAAEVESGLVLDILKFHTTSRGTSEARTKKELKKRYSHIKEVLESLLTRFEELYLLVESKTTGSDEDLETKIQTRLAHDTIAPLIRERFDMSDQPGQRALRSIENKAGEWQDGSVGSKLDRADLHVVDAGATGMRAKDEDEERLLKASHRVKNIQNYILIFVSLAIIALMILVFNLVLDTRKSDIEKANLAATTDKERARVQAARIVSLAESQKDPLLSTLLLLSLKGQSEPSHGVRVALKTVQKPIPRDIMREHTKTVSKVECNPIMGQVITASNDGTAKVWSLEGRQEPMSLEGHDGALRGAMFNQFGDRYVTWTKNTVYMWDGSKTPSKTLVGCHANNIYSVALRPDGQHLLTATATRTAKDKSIRKGKIRVWDVHNQGELDDSRIKDCNIDNAPGGYYGKLIESLEIPETEGFQDPAVITASYSPDGRYVVSTLKDGRIIIWSVAGNKYHKPYTSTYHEGSAVRFAVFSNKNEDLADKNVYLATVDVSNNKVMLLWELDVSEDTGEVIGLSGPWTLNGHSESIKGVIFSPDNSQILTISGDKTAMLWNLDMKGDADNPFNPVKLIGHSEGLSSGEFSPDGKYVVTGSGDDTLRIWNLGQIEDSELKDSLELTGYTDKGHTDDVTDVVFCPDSNSVVSTSRDKQVRLWDVNGSSEPLLLIKEKSPALDAKFSPDGAYIAAAFKKSPAKIWKNDRQNHKLIFKRKLGVEPVRSIDFSPKFDENYDETVFKVLTVRDRVDASTSNTPVQEWWLKDSPAKTLSSIQGQFSNALYHPNTEGYFITVPKTEGDKAKIWDGKGGETSLYSHDINDERIRYAEISNDGSKVVTATGPNALISSFMDQECIETNEKCSKWDEKCKVAGDEKCEAALEACEADKTCVVENYKGEGLFLTMAVFSHDGLEVATASADGQVRVFRADSQKVYPPFPAAVKSIEFDPQDQRLLAASHSGEARIWNKDGSGEPILLKVNDEAMNSARFDPHTERVVTASADGSVRVWRYQWDHLLDYLDSTTRVCLTTEQRMRFLNEEHETADMEHRKCMNLVKTREDDECCASEL